MAPRIYRSETLRAGDFFTCENKIALDNLECNTDVKVEQARARFQFREFTYMTGAEFDSVVYRKHKSILFLFSVSPRLGSSKALNSVPESSSLGSLS